MDSSSSGLLDGNIQALPQELQDLILEFLEEIQTPDRIILTTHYKPPSALQLNRKRRAEFAKKYYSTTVFEFLTCEPLSGAEPYLSVLVPQTGQWHFSLIWLRNVDVGHRTILRALCISLLGPGSAPLPEPLPELPPETPLETPALRSRLDENSRTARMAIMTISGREYRNADIRVQYLSRARWSQVHATLPDEDWCYAYAKP